MWRGWCSRPVRAAGRGNGPAPGGWPVHPRREPSQLPRRRRARHRGAAADLLPRHAARVPREAAASVLSPPDRLDPGRPRAPRSRRHQARAARARGGPRRRHLPRGAVQPRGPSRPRPARARWSPCGPACRSSPPRSGAPTRRSADGASTCRARFRWRSASGRRCISAAPAAGHPRRSGTTSAADHGRDRGAPARGACPRGGRRPRGRVVTAAETPPGKAWSGRFAEGADPTAEAFTRRSPSTAASGPTTSRAARPGRARSPGRADHRGELEILEGLAPSARRSRAAASRSGASSRTST